MPGGDTLVRLVVQEPALVEGTVLRQGNIHLQRVQRNPLLKDVCLRQAVGRYLFGSCNGTVGEEDLPAKAQILYGARRHVVPETVGAERLPHPDPATAAGEQERETAESEKR